MTQRRRYGHSDVTLLGPGSSPEREADQHRVVRREGRTGPRVDVEGPHDVRVPRHDLCARTLPPTLVSEAYLRSGFGVQHPTGLPPVYGDDKHAVRISRPGGERRAPP